MITFTKVSPGEELRACWTEVHEGLVDNIQYHGEIHAPALVCERLIEHSAELFLIHDDQTYLGFAVTTIEGRGLRLNPYLYLWQVHAPGLMEGGRFDQYMGWLDRLAAERGLTAIRMNTTRRGWERAIRRYARPALVEYERIVPHG